CARYSANYKRVFDSW
nr:immunoglobulin heavy chain junction region [Macaca mulatta]MOV36022.1 immunoglobulin heavy chain junction region [Macaca mulatta]MOV36226.1 immunoglobulin heavy chain junction region [Macaca mulatta]MOV36628.1 immunoglobulin heavy chain junction region [Macaca mulatta]MOV36723.1 immunoglobulin heavy chain junction region [Macaca mulatta]